MSNSDTVNHPSHYTDCFPPIQIECIDFTKDMSFLRGNAFKYVWRAGNKNNAVEDLKKALWYLEEDFPMAGGSVIDNIEWWCVCYRHLLNSSLTSVDKRRLNILDFIAHGSFFAAKSEIISWIKDIETAEMLEND